MASRWALSLALSFYLSLQVGTREAREEEREETVQEDCSRSSLFYYKMRHSTNALWRQSNEQLFFLLFAYVFLFFLLTLSHFFSISLSRILSLSLPFFHFLSFLLRVSHIQAYILSFSLPFNIIRLSHTEFHTRVVSCTHSHWLPRKIHVYACTSIPGYIISDNIILHLYPFLH